MLILARKLGERIHVGGAIVVTVVRGRGDRVRLGGAAPPGLAVRRAEGEPRRAGPRRALADSAPATRKPSIATEQGLDSAGGRSISRPQRSTAGDAAGRRAARQASAVPRAPGRGAGAGRSAAAGGSMATSAA